MQRASNEALREGANVVKSAISTHTPVGSGNRGGHARDSVEINGLKSGGGDKTISIGYDSGHFWYMWFVEMGTYSKGNPKGIAPRKHFQRAWQSSYSAAYEQIASVLASRGLM